MVGYVLTKLTRPITRLLERDLRRREEKGKVGEVNKRWVGLCMCKEWRWRKLLWSRGGVGRRGEGGSTHRFFIVVISVTVLYEEFMFIHKIWLW